MELLTENIHAHESTIADIDMKKLHRYLHFNLDKIEKLLVSKGSENDKRLDSEFSIHPSLSSNKKIFAELSTLLARINNI